MGHGILNSVFVAMVVAALRGGSVYRVDLLHAEAFADVFYRDNPSVEGGDLSEDTLVAVAVRQPCTSCTTKGVRTPSSRP